MKRILFFSIIIASILIVNSLVRSIYTLWQKQDLTVKAQKELEQKKKENQDIKKKLSYVQSPQFVEEEARNKLFMVKPGEKEVFIPKNLLEASDSAQNLKIENEPNWEKWWNLFF